MHSTKMTPTELRATISLSSIMGLRMVGLFMVLPVFSLYASTLAGATPMLIGLAMGIYGLSQAIFQITFGVLSDRIGRKPAILISLIIFAAGSIVAGMADSINMMIIGRTLQGIGAVGSTILALMADLTREEQRIWLALTKSSQKAEVSDAKVLRFVYNCEIEERFPLLRDHRRKRCKQFRLRHQAICFEVRPNGLEYRPQDPTLGF